jgi:diguanylate cyclase (GGDEF)-like protein
MKVKTTKKSTFFLSNAAILFFIISGFCIVVYRDTRSYQNLAETHLENIVSLADVNIEKFIETEMNKPVTVSKTMANDEFLKSWIRTEPAAEKPAGTAPALSAYLKAYQQKYGYTTVFFVSAKTGSYYYQDGRYKTISSDDPHDIWYYNFVNSGHEYDLQIDTSQADHNHITLFINFRVEDKNGRLLGIIGVGQQVDFLENLLHSYEQEYGLSVYIINARGARNSFSGTTVNFINTEELQDKVGLPVTAAILDPAHNAHIQWFEVDHEKKCIITRYNESLGWYIIVTKDTATITNTFTGRIKTNILFVLLTLCSCLAITTVIFISYHRQITTQENIDDVTGLPNQRLFARTYPRFLLKHRKQQITLYMFDIDNFKTINDTYGHLFGNAVLKMTAAKLTALTTTAGITARWGGDEFIGLFAGDEKQTAAMLKELMEALLSEETDARCRITISAGITALHGHQTLEQLVDRADSALYCSKKNGKNQLSVCPS